MPDSRGSAEHGEKPFQSQFRNSVPNRTRLGLHCMMSSLSMHCFQGLKVTCRSSRYGEIWLSSRCRDLVAGGFCALRNKRMQIGALNADTPARGQAGVLYYTSSGVHFSRRLPTMTHFGESGRRTSSSRRSSRDNVAHSENDGRVSLSLSTGASPCPFTPSLDPPKLRRGIRGD